jgi:regulator of protease activity HflC (stomatin/prohibitin superfamily)
MRSSRRSFTQVLREARLPKGERRAARLEREAEEQMRRERDNPLVAERIAARNAAEARRHSNHSGL